MAFPPSAKSLAPEIAASSRRRVASSVVVPLALTALAFFVALFSKGFLEPDEISHFLFARAALHDWRQLTNVWARLGPTALYALAAPLGPIGPRLLAVGITALTAHLTARLLRHYLPQTISPFFRRHATAFAWLLLFAQPCFFLNSFAIMTEMPLALAWTAATLALLNRRINLTGILLGLGGLVRPEAWLALATWPFLLFFFLTRRKDVFAATPPDSHHLGRGVLTSVLLSLAPPFLWIMLWAIAWFDPNRFATTFPWTANPYHPTALLFLLSATVALAFWMWPFVLFGARASSRTPAPPPPPPPQLPIANYQ